MSFKKSSHDLAHLPARPRLVSDLNQWSQEGQVYPVGMDPWLPGESREGKQAKMGLRERQIQSVTLSEQVSHGAWWPPYPQGSRPSLIQHTSYFQCCLQLFIILKLRFSQIGLLTSLPCTRISHHLCDSAHDSSRLECPLLNIQIYLLQGDFFFPARLRVIYLFETIPYIPLINWSSLPRFYCYLKCHSHLIWLLCWYIFFINISSLKTRVLSYYPHISQGIDNSTQ